MTTTVRRTLTGLATLALLAGGMIVSSDATAAPELRATYRISGSNFLRAFRDVVEEPRTWTVRVRRQHPRTERWTDAALGVVVRSDGLVLTKASEMIGPLRVKLADHPGESFEAELIASDSKLDLAILRIDMSDLTPLPTVEWSNSSRGLIDDPDVGRWVVTPTIYSSPAAVGIVSVPRRKIPRTELPGMLGVKFDDLYRDSVIGGGRIDEVTVDSPADNAGLQVGDIIVSVNGRSTRSFMGVIAMISKYHPGDMVTLRIRHDDATSDTIRVTLSQPNIALLQAKQMRFDMMNNLGGSLSERRSNFPAAIQHDSVLDPTDCGGAALNLDGKAVGINIARAGRTESLMLPAELVIDAVERLLRTVE